MPTPDKPITTVADLRLFTMYSDSETSLHSLTLRAHEAAVWAHAGEPLTPDEEEAGTDCPDNDRVYDYLEAHPELLDGGHRP